MTKKEIEEMARGLDHAAMSAMELENRTLKNQNKELLEAAKNLLKDLVENYKKDWKDIPKHLALLNAIKKAESK